MTNETCGITMGNRVVDLVSGFSGIAIQSVEYINGNIQWGVQPRVNETGSFPEVVLIDYHMLAFDNVGVADHVTPCVDTSGIELGDTVTDTASGFTGVATQRCEYLNGCTRYGVVPKILITDLINQNTSESYVDNYRLCVVHKARAAEITNDVEDEKIDKPSGGPSNRLTRNSIPR